MSTPHEVRLLIGGRWSHGTGAEFSNINPARPDEVVADSSTLPPWIVLSLSRARRFPVWAATPYRERAEVLWRAADVLDDRAEPWATELGR